MAFSHQASHDHAKRLVQDSAKRLNDDPRPLAYFKSGIIMHAARRDGDVWFCECGQFWVGRKHP